MDASHPKFLDYKRARFVTQLPLDYLYSPSHFWLAPQPDQSWRVGLTKFASRMLGEMVDYGFELPPDAPVAPGQVIGWMEGFKARSDLFCVAAGHFLGGNPALEANPALINQDPYGAGWLYAVRGQPDAACLDVHGYMQLLNHTIDRILEKP